MIVFTTPATASEPYSADLATFKNFDMDQYSLLEIICRSKVRLTPEASCYGGTPSSKIKRELYWMAPRRNNDLSLPGLLFAPFTIIPDCSVSICAQCFSLAAVNLL